MRREAFLKMIGLSLFVLIFAAPAAVGAGKGVVIKMATLAPEGSAWMQIFNELNAEIKKKTDGNIRFRLYPGGVLGDETDMLRKMVIGQIQGVALSAPGLSGLNRDMEVFQIPFLFQTYDEVDHVLKKMSGFFKKGFEKKGYVLLGWSEGGFVRLMSTTPISSIDDLKKAKVWTWEAAPMAEAIFDATGVSAIPLSVPDVLVGLQTGLVDVVYAPPAGAISLQWFTKVRYLTDVPLIYLAGGILVKKNIFERISKRYQGTLMELLQQYMVKMKEVIRNENREAIRVMANHGIKIVHPSDEQTAKFKQIAKKAIEQLNDTRFSKAVLEQIYTHLEEHRKEKK
ncbi:MAG: TRAP transporter substrate-binding protein DctP [Desulfobacterales bacterium]|nr:TRAP transporter substrate-binding protein DctP [Desulfobacterales bacterium]